MKSMNIRKYKNTLYVKALVKNKNSFVVFNCDQGVLTYSYKVKTWLFRREIMHGKAAYWTQTLRMLCAEYQNWMDEKFSLSSKNI